MARVARTRRRLAAAAVALGAASVASFAQTQNRVAEPLLEQTAPDRSIGVSGLTTGEVIAKMIERNRIREELLHRYSAVRTYEIRSNEGKLAAQAVVHVTFEAPDKKTFSKTFEQGSAIVRHMVFDRLMRTEGETASGAKHHDSAITAANYSFTPVGQQDIGAYHCYVFDAAPKRKDKYLFEGRIWIDAEDFAIVKIAGHPAKEPSFWVSRADFVRQYQKIDGFWVPYRDETTVDVKIYGQKTFIVNHQQYAINSASPIQAATGEGTAVD